MRTAPVNTIVLPAVYGANLKFRAFPAFVHARYIDLARALSRIRARANAEGSAL